MAFVKFECYTFFMKFSYRIYMPSYRHKKIRLLKMYSNGSSESVHSPVLDEINNQLLARKIIPLAARTLVAQLRENLNAEAGIARLRPVHNSDNHKVLAAYWAYEYKPRLSSLVDWKTAYWALERSADAVGEVSLRTGTRNELQAAIDSRLSGNKQRRAVSKINDILRFLKKDFRLFLAKKTKTEVSHITKNELSPLIGKLDPKVALLHKVAFATGMRIGELRAMEDRFYNRSNNTYKVLWQIDKHGVRRSTKNEKSRTTFVLPEYRQDVEAWIKMAPTFNHKLSLRMARITCAASLKALNRPLKFHDLRHSYAIHLLGFGVPLSHVAQCLGNSIQVAEEYYLGYEISSGAIGMLNMLVKGPESANMPVKQPEPPNPEL